MASNAIRWPRLGSPRIFMLPLDHGISMGPEKGLVDVEATLHAVTGLATCTTVHKGLLPRVAPFGRHMGILMHLSASTDGSPDPHDKRLVGSVAEAARYGCDGVSVHVNVGSRTEANQLEDMGRVSAQCHEYGMPLVAMMYPRGPHVANPFDAKLVAHAARLGYELGADAVKVPYTGDAGTFRDVVQGVAVPVLVAGGPKRADPAALLADLRGAAQAGAAGISLGRNVFQADDPRQMMQQLVKVFA